MGLFSRKEEQPTVVRGADDYESNGRGLLGSAGDDMDAETDVVGELEFRDGLCMFISIGENDGEDTSTGRVPCAFTLDARGDRLAVALDAWTFG